MLPCSATRPPSITTMRSTSLRVASRWAMTMAARPSHSSRSDCWMRASVSESSADVASSRMTRSDSLRNARAIAALVSVVWVEMVGV